MVSLLDPVTGTAVSFESPRLLLNGNRSVEARVALTREAGGHLRRHNGAILQMELAEDDVLGTCTFVLKTVIGLTEPTSMILRQAPSEFPVAIREDSDAQQPATALGKPRCEVVN